MDTVLSEEKASLYLNELTRIRAVIIDKVSRLFFNVLSY